MSAEEIESVRRQLLSKPKEPAIPSRAPRKKRSDYTLQEWTEYKRAREREYDAKRRAKKREEGATMPLEQRREMREAAKKRANPASSSVALDIVVAAAQALQKAGEEPASGALGELQVHLREILVKNSGVN